ncbi:polyketide synthase dehydratase domain-containing protein [Streptomyces sp. GKU 257-1]|nr:polyketide synthase dehydratase domain-containing protein [Streptomyces sp. GKU 257-1]
MQTGRLSLSSHPWLAGHRVRGRVVVPGTALLDMALQAGTDGEAVDELTLLAPVLVPEQGEIELQLQVEPADGSGPQAAAAVCAGGARTDWRLHAAGALSAPTGPADTVGPDIATTGRPPTPNRPNRPTRHLVRGPGRTGPGVRARLPRPAGAVAARRRTVRRGGLGRAGTCGAAGRRAAPGAGPGDRARAAFRSPGTGCGGWTGTRRRRATRLRGRLTLLADGSVPCRAGRRRHRPRNPVRRLPGAASAERRPGRPRGRRSGAVRADLAPRRAGRGARGTRRAGRAPRPRGRHRAALPDRRGRPARQDPRGDLGAAGRVADLAGRDRDHRRTPGGGDPRRRAGRRRRGHRRGTGGRCRNPRPAGPRGGRGARPRTVRADGESGPVVLVDTDDPDGLPRVLPSVLASGEDRVLVREGGYTGCRASSAPRRTPDPPGPRSPPTARC